MTLTAWRGAALLACALFGWVSVAGAQEPCSAPEASQFDFWLGEWELTWPGEQTGLPAGEIGRGTNRVEKILDGCVVQESFSVADGSYRGLSVSLYNPGKGLWEQTWVDSGGAYITLTGGFEGGVMELRTEPRQRAGETVINRMLFSDVTDDAFDWVWQASRDDGETWTDVWTIRYQRKP